MVYYVLVNTKTGKITLVTSETEFWSRNKCYFGPIYKDGSDIHGFDKVTLVYFVLVNTKTDKVTLVTSETAFWSRKKCYFGPMYKDGSDFDGYDKVTLVSLESHFGLVETKLTK